MPFSTIAIYHQVQGWGESTMVITTDMLPTVAADFIGATGYFSEDGRRWEFTIRSEGDTLKAVWAPQEGQRHYQPATLEFGQPVEVGSYIDRHDHGADNPDEYEIDYIGPELV